MSYNIDNVEIVSKELKDMGTVANKLREFHEAGRNQ